MNTGSSPAELRAVEALIRQHSMWPAAVVRATWRAARAYSEERERVLREALVKAEAVISLSKRGRVNTAPGPATHQYRIQEGEAVALLAEIRGALATQGASVASGETKR